MYARSIERSGEIIVARAKLHWLYLLWFAGAGGIKLPWYLFFLFPIVWILRLLYWMAPLAYFALGVAYAGSGSWGAAFEQTTTEINLDQVEAIHIKRTLIGRIFGYGTLVVDGSGGTETGIFFVQSPVTIRNAVARATSKVREA